MTHPGASCNLAKPQDITDQLADSKGIHTQFRSWLPPKHKRNEGWHKAGELHTLPSSVHNESESLC